MNIFVIDDDAQFATALSDRLSDISGQSCQPIVIKGSDDTFILSDTIKISLTPESILFINANLKVSKYMRQNYKGIELLTWLRIKGVLNHCIIYSFESSDTIAKRSHKNILLFSKGTTFVRLPNDFSSFDLPQIKDDIAERENLKTYLKPIFDVSEFRHRNANWWSVKLLWDVHRVATEGRFAKDYPQHVKDNLSQLNKAVGVFLHELEVINVVKYTERILHDIKNLKDDLEMKIAEFGAEKGRAEIDHQGWQAIISDYSKKIEDINTNFLRYFANTSREYQEYEVQRAELVSELQDYKTENQRVEGVLAELQNQLAYCINQIEAHELSLKNIYTTVKKELFGGRHVPTIRTRPNILLIDDNAENGWKDICNEMFPSALIRAPLIRAKEPKKAYKETMDDLYHHDIKPEIEEINKLESPFLILLDLRLFDETERSIDLANLSGKLLLEKIKRDFRGIPIIITTASNKVWTFQKLINLGADAYWVKEGLDEQRTAEDSVNNYLRLSDLIYRMTDGRYDDLRSFSSYARKFDEGKSYHWSNNINWLNGEQTQGDVEAISRSLNDSVLVIKNYLHNYHLGYGFGEGPDEAFILSGLINKIGGVYESVHNDPDYVGGGILRDARGDLNLDVIRNMRNTFSHRSYTEAKWEDLKRCIDETIKYLDTPFELISLNIASAKTEGDKLEIILEDNSKIEFEYIIADEYDFSGILQSVTVEKLKASKAIQDVYLSKASIDTIRAKLNGLIGNVLEVKFDASTTYDVTASELSIRINNDLINKKIQVPVKEYDPLIQNLDCLKRQEIVFSINKEPGGGYQWKDKNPKIRAACGPGKQRW